MVGTSAMPKSLDTPGQVRVSSSHSNSVWEDKFICLWPLGWLQCWRSRASLCAIPSSASAQAVTGTLLGNITDSSGGAVPGVTVTATEVQTNVSRSAVTNEAGYYSSPSLSERHLLRRRRAAGLQEGHPRERRGRGQHHHPRRPDARSRRDEEAVTVSAETPAAADRPHRHRPADRVEDGHRHAADLQPQLPGPAGHRAGRDAPAPRSLGLLQLAGLAVDRSQRPVAPREQHDDRRRRRQPEDRPAAGDHSRRPTRSRPSASSTSNYDAEFGRSGGAITNVTLKSGTNQFKGTVFVFGNNENTNAGDYFTHTKAPDQVRQQRLHARRSDLPSNKLFFFGDYQRTIDNAGYIVRATVPTAAMRNGDFSAVSQHIYDPLTGDIGGTNRAPFANNQIPADRISPIAQQLIGVHPAAEHPGAALGQNNYQCRRRRARRRPTGSTPRSTTRSARRIRCRRASASCGRSCSIRGCSVSTAARPTAASPAPAPTPATARR